MASQQPSAWQTSSRSRNSNSAQNRSATQSPNQQAAPSQPPSRPDGGRVQMPPANNVWTQRSVMVGGSNGQAQTENTRHREGFQPANGFNATEVKDFLGKDVGSVAVYKPSEVSSASETSSSAVEAASGNMANNQPFFVQLAKQVATIEGGG